MHRLPSIKQHKRCLQVGAAPSFQSLGGHWRADRRPMGEDIFASVAPPPPSALRLLGLLKQPDPDPDLEFDESDVVWSTTTDDARFSSPSSSAAESEDRDSSNRFSSQPPSPDVLHSPLAASSCSPSGQLHRPYAPERCGLSVALADDLVPLVRQLRPAARATRPLAASARRAEEALLAERADYNQSAPVNVPTWSKWRKGPKAEVMEGLEEEERWDKEMQSEEEVEEEMVPPHVTVAKSHLTTFSVFEGVGRTLKGRDLRRVRNAVLKKTGFIDV